MSSISYIFDDGTTIDFASDPLTMIIAVGVEKYGSKMFCRLIGATRANLWSWRNGTKPRPDMIARIAKHAGVPMSVFVDREPSQPGNV